MFWNDTPAGWGTSSAGWGISSSHYSLLVCHMIIQIHFFSLGLSHDNPDPFFFSLGLSHGNPDPFFHWACLRPQTKSVPVVIAVTQAVWFCGRSQGLPLILGVVASPCHLHCLDTIIQYIVVRKIIREYHSPSARKSRLWGRYTQSLAVPKW